MKWIANLIKVLFLAVFLFIVTRGNMMFWLALFGVSLLLAIFFGRIYCGFVCPMNTVMLPAEWISKKLKLQRDKTPKILKSGIFSWLFLGISIVIMIASKKILHINIPILMIWVAISFVVTLVFKPHVFHNLICPFGALQRTFGRYSLFSKRVDAATCVGCAKCEKVCPSEAIHVKDDKKAYITKRHCLQCTNCSDACSVNAIDYGKSR